MSNIFEIIALDKDFQVVALIGATNIQWNRKYYEPGTFSIQVLSDQYDSSWKYIYTKDRPEVGEISQINFSISNGVHWLQLSGYFLENELNRRVVYQKSNVTNITNEPSWAVQSGAAEDVALAFYNAFANPAYTYDSTSYISTLGIDVAASSGRGKNSVHTRDGSYLGNKMYAILKPSKMSLRVEYDFENNTKTLKCWKGTDRTQDNTESNNPIIFSTEYGNLKEPNVLWADSDYKNCYVVMGKHTENNVDSVTIEAANEAKSSDASDRFLMVESNLNYSDYSSDSAYQAALLSEGHNEVLNKPISMSFDFEAIAGSYEYMTDFDLGDICSIELPEIGLSVDAVLSGCAEVIKAGNWSLTMEFDI